MDNWKCTGAVDRIFMETEEYKGTHERDKTKQTWSHSNHGTLSSARGN